MAFIGYGEAARAFATAPGWRGDIRAYDVLAERTICPSLADAIADAPLVLSLVTAGQALVAAQAAAAHLMPGALFCDMNSVGPDTKRAAREVLEAAGGRYVDVAIMTPVHPRLDVPLLVAGLHAAPACTVLADAGFTNIRVVAGDIGTAATIKLIRSVMIKGIEALTGEMMAAAACAGVTDAVLASLGSEWAAKATYNLERMAAHGHRRAEEMEEAARTLTSLGVDPVMTRATIICQRAAAQTALEQAA